jgi:hypothetical protein
MDGRLDPAGKQAEWAKVQETQCGESGVTGEVAQRRKTTLRLDEARRDHKRSVVVEMGNQGSTRRQKKESGVVVCATRGVKDDS